MTTDGIKGILIETHNWGKTVAFWKALGYELEFETDHHSGQLRHPSGGPYLFIAERSENAPIRVQPMLWVADATGFVPPRSGSCSRPFEPQHWGVLESLIADPDGREFSVQAPIGPSDATPDREKHHG
ncbi:MAG TPA: hypothetical protein VFQ61_35470 [Polyangiaceae bacterium]|nr:hypothetical protein [Polyangiaceae bacterium]